MKVQDLIRKLMDLPLDAEVCYRDGTGGEDVFIITEVFVETMVDEGKETKGVVIG